MMSIDSGSKPMVYSTEHGRICPDCNQPIAGCLCRVRQPAGRGDGVVRICRETKGRKGKGVTVISGVPLDQPGLLELAKDLRRRCGCGGTVKDGKIEIQGDHRSLLLGVLQKSGWQVKLCGG